jgi:CrcB protein
VRSLLFCFSFHARKPLQSQTGIRILNLYPARFYPKFRALSIQLQKLLLIALAGALGTVARYGLGGVVQRAAGAEFPWGTLVVNITGCFLAGLLWSIFEPRISFAPYRIIIFVGFLGGFTTFSSFALETGELMRDAEWLRAAGNMVLQNGIGVIALFGGLSLGRLI